MSQYFLKNYYGYYILYFWLLISILFSEGLSNEKLRKYIKILTFYIVAFFIIFRFDVEFDYVWYWIVGDNSFKEYWIYKFEYNRIELFFKMVYWVTRKLNNPKFFFIITGMVFSYFFFKSINKYCKNKLFSLSLFCLISGIYFSFLVGFIRQGIAVVIYLFFIDNLFKKKYKIYIFINLLIGLTVHKSALIVLGLIPIHKYYKKNKKILIFIELIFFILILNVEKILKIIPELNKYLFYISEWKSNFLLGYKYILVVVVLYLGINIWIKIRGLKLTEEEKFQSHILNLGIIIFVLLSIKIGGHVPLRVAIYFLVIFPVIFSNILEKIKNKRHIVIFIVIILFMISNINLLKISKNEYKLKEGRAVYNYKLLFFNNYKDLNGKYTPHGKIEFNN